MSEDPPSTIGVPPSRGNKPAGRKRKKEDDLKEAEVRLEGFDVGSSAIWTAIVKQYGSRVSHNELVAIAQMVASYAGLTLDRGARRRKTVLLKWFDENAAAIMPVLPRVVLEPTHG
jgi:hypothetical protein